MKTMTKKSIGYLLLVVSAIITVVALFFIAPVEQNEEYHNFSDKNTVLNIPNFWNVISNIPFLVIGIIGIKSSKLFTNGIQYIWFFLGIALVSFGSGYYHLNPNNNTLVWDRLPMTISFMSLFSIIISEFVNIKVGLSMLFPSIIIGILSVVYWVIFDDLRLYILVQFFPLIAILIILIFFKSNYNFTIGYWLLLIAYIVAKFFEHLDYQTQNILKIFSGHTLKHLIISIGIISLLYSYVKREETKTY